MNLRSFARSSDRVAATSGGEYAGPCPKCGGTDRFRVWPDNGETGRFMCRRCGWQGDGIQFVRETTGVSYRDARAALGMSPPATGGHKPKLSPCVPPWGPKPSVLPGEDWSVAADAFVSRCSEAMATHEQGRAYAASRGLEPKTIVALRIGWNPSDIYQDREAWGLPPEINPTTGRARRVWLPSGLVVPTIHDGRVVNLKIRRDRWGQAGDKRPKYANVPGGSSGPMVISPGEGKPAMIVESELDAILVAQHARDLVCAIAVRTAQGKPDIQTMQHLSGPVLVSLDTDQAGADGAFWWKTHFPYPKSKRWPVPVEYGKDPSDMLPSGLLRLWVELAVQYYDKPSGQEQARPVYQPMTPCPYTPEVLARYRVEKPHLVCCPATRPLPWWWLDRGVCAVCKTPCAEKEHAHAAG